MCLMEQQDITFSEAFWWLGSVLSKFILSFIMMFFLCHLFLILITSMYAMAMNYGKTIPRLSYPLRHQTEPISSFIYCFFIPERYEWICLKKHILLYVLPVTCQIWGDLVVLVPSILFRRIQILWLFHSNLSDWCSSKVPTQLLWPLKQPASLLILYIFFLFSSNHKIREWIYSRLYVCRRFSNDFLLIYIRNV